MKVGRFLTAAMIVFALVVVSLSAYVGGYLWLSDRRSIPVFWSARPSQAAIDTIFRFYPRQWQATIFKPAGGLEAWYMGCDVIVEGGDAASQRKMSIDLLDSAALRQ
jgi:hypothetical protein